MSQGCVECGNQVMKGLIWQHQSSNSTGSWVKFLPDVACKLPEDGIFKLASNLSIRFHGSVGFYVCNAFASLLQTRGTI